MSLKQLIRRKQLYSQANTEFVMYGEPSIYSTKWDIAVNHRKLKHARDTRYDSMLRVVFPSFIGYKNQKSKQAVVLLATFYVPPPASVRISSAKLQEEKTPASDSFELCEYLLSLMEKFRGVLINSYRQIVKFECEKFYSNSPRTVLHFMSWIKYVELSNKAAVHSEAEVERPHVEGESVQPTAQRDAAIKRLYR